MKASIIHSVDGTTLRYYTVAGRECIDKCIMFNGSPGDYQDKLFAIYEQIGNNSMVRCILWSEGKHEALNDAVDLNLLDHLMISDEEKEKDDFNEDDYCALGNAGELFDLSGIAYEEIKPKEYRADADFMYALGRAAENTEINTADDL